MAPALGFGRFRDLAFLNFHAGFLLDCPKLMRNPATPSNMTLPVISLLLPTRGRPALVERFFQSVVEMTAHPERVEVVLYIDEDDCGSHHLDCPGIRVTKIIGPRMTMGAYNTACLEKATGSIIMLVNDDMVIRTKGWDERIVALDGSFPDGIYLVYGNDLLKKSNMCTFPILSRRTCELLVEPYPKAYLGAFIDFHLLDIFKRLQHLGFDRIRYLDDVVFEHLHHRAGKAAIDDTYLKRGRFDDDSIFFAQSGVRRIGAKRLVGALQGVEALPSEKRNATKVMPTDFFGAAWYSTRELLFDQGLPLRWRSHVWAWFLARYLARKGLLRPFVR